MGGLIGNFRKEINPLTIESISRTKDGFTTISYRDSDNKVKSYVCALANTYIANDDKIILSEYARMNFFGWKNKSNCNTIRIDNIGEPSRSLHELLPFWNYVIL